MVGMVVVVAMNILFYYVVYIFLLNYLYYFNGLNVKIKSLILSVL